MKHYQTILVLALCISGTGCAITSGFQTYDVPEEGSFQTDLGTSVDVIKITANNLPTIQSTANALPTGSLTSLFTQRSSIYTLSAGDILSIQLWNYPEIAPTTISNEQSVQAYGYSIDQEGYIQFPLVGRYKASGKSLAQVNRELRSRLGQYLKNPDVVVRVLSYEGKRYSVQGSVTKGGQFFLSDQPVSVYTALGLAGGVTDKGDDTSLQLIRNGITYDLNSIALEKQGYSLHKLLIQPNDTLYVNSRENQKIYVMGESGKNQALEMRNQGMSLSDVLGESLGINPNSASASRIYVLRNDQQMHRTQLYHLNLLSFSDFGLANQFQMKKNDIVYIDATGLTRWQRVINQIIPFSNALYNIDRLGQ